MENQSEKPTGTANVTLDDSIFRFWNDFVSKQIGAGRRDVGRMLEVALEFYFERSTQVDGDDLRRRQSLETFTRHVRSEIAKCQATLGKAAQDGNLALPYRGLQITVRTDGVEMPVESKPYPAAFTRVAELANYHSNLLKQASAAEQVVQLITDKLVKQRKGIAQRLKELSPLLYQQGVNMIATADAKKAAATPVVQPEAVVVQPEAAPAQTSVWSLVKRVVANFSGAPAKPQATGPSAEEVDAKLQVFQDLAAKWSKER